MEKVIITIDGPSASGKSSVAKLVAKRLNYRYIDSGAMYRCICLYMLNNNIELEEIEKHLNEVDIQFIDDKIILNGVDVSNDIRSDQIARLVANVSANGKVREYLVSLQQSYGKEKEIVMDGRDIGSVVFKDAKVKIYQVASVATRAKRRYDELISRGYEVNLKDIEKDIEQRDYIDSTREISPLVKPDDAYVLDTSNLSIEEAVDKIIEIYKNKVIK